jgi:hypothetical protein
MLHKKVDLICFFKEIQFNFEILNFFLLTNLIQSKHSKNEIKFQSLSIQSFKAFIKKRFNPLLKKRFNSIFKIFNFQNFFYQQKFNSIKSIKSQQKWNQILITFHPNHFSCYEKRALIHFQRRNSIQFLKFFFF